MSVSLRHLNKNELLVVLSALSSQNFIILDRITDESSCNILSRILGEKNNEWWLYLQRNKYISDFLKVYPIYDVFNNNYPKNVIHFFHDYINYDFVCDFLEEYKKNNITSNDSNLFFALYDKYTLNMNKKEREFYNWLKLPLDKRNLEDETLSRWFL
jgi:hypothetical protein